MRPEAAEPVIAAPVIRLSGEHTRSTTPEELACNRGVHVEASYRVRLHPSETQGQFQQVFSAGGRGGDPHLRLPRQSDLALSAAAMLVTSLQSRYVVASR